MLTYEQIQGWIERLKDARYQGIRTLRDQNGKEITYRSDRELSAAIYAAEAELRALTSGRRPSIIKPIMTKGL